MWSPIYINMQYALIPNKTFTNLYKFGLKLTGVPFSERS